ncbi:MAG: hypothetical protein ACPLSK_04565, partial [bacterium]
MKTLVLSFLTLFLLSPLIPQQLEVKNLRYKCVDMKLKIEMGTLLIKGKTIPIEPKEFLIPPPSQIEIRDEIVNIGDEKPQGWWAGTRLTGPKTPHLYHCLPGCLVPHSVIVKSADGSIIYEEGRDYLVDQIWGAIGRVPSGRIPRGGTVLVSYKYSLQRMDLIEVNEEGKLLLKKGKEEKTCPLPPKPDKGYYPLLHIFLPYHTRELSDELIYPIGAPFPFPEREEIIANSRFVEKTLRKLKNGDKVTIVFWGDSVTAGGDASSPAKAFPARFTSYLKKRFPKAIIEMVNAGIGGTNT